MVKKLETEISSQRSKPVEFLEYSNYLIEHGGEETVKTTIWPVIANDLSYVGQYW